ncbi:MAG TPA: DUF3619 family protein [Burkholderiales bacterium]|nr:DUF3619 family protein [Burkholderiales bacterium]
MNQPEQELARKLVQHLDDGVDRLAPDVRERLATARRAALSQYREQSAPVFGLSWAGQAAARLGGNRLYEGRNLVAVAAFMVALAGIAWWQVSNNPVNDIADIDTSLLTDELPVNAYLDKGFDSWLKRSSR